VGGFYEIDGVRPVVDPSAFVHPDATVIGDVIIGPNTYIGPLASLRGDFGRIVVGAGSNVQDGCVLHAFPGRDLVIEADGHIAHGSILHGCEVGAGALIGMNSVVMDGARIGSRSFVAANSFVPAEFELPDESLAVGSPAKVARGLTEAEMAWKANGTRVYQDLARRSRATLRPTDPLAEPEPDRPRVSTTSDTAVPLREFRTRD
jgi:phenylacetic acid degradation protein